MKKALFLLLVLFAQQTRIYSQEIYIDLVKRVSTVDYIFEGIVLKTYPYKTADDKTIYTSNVIQITKVFKGDISCGTIELLTTGGDVGDTSMHGSHTLEMKKGDQGVFLCSASTKELPSIAVYAFSIPDKVEATYEWQSFIKYNKENGDWKAYDLWQKFEDIATLYNLTELLTQINYIDCGAQGLVLQSDTPSIHQMQPYRPDLMPVYSKIEHKKILDYADLKRTNYQRVKSNRSTSTINYTLSAPIITGTTPKYCEFDVLVSDNLGTGYLDQSAVRIQYSTSTFGANVVANNKIEVTRGTINADSNCYSHVIPDDRTNDAFLVPALEAVYSQCKKPILTTPQSIMHIKMEIQNCNGGSVAIQDTVTFIGPSLMLLYSAYAAFPNDTFQTYYDAINIGGGFTVPDCRTKVTSFEPDTVRGGIGDILKIHGYQFGTTQGNIYMPNANSNILQYIQLDPADITAWSDTLITVNVPSIDTGAIRKIPGSGKVIVENITGVVQRDTSTNPLTVFYSLYNYINSTTAVTRFTYLYNENTSGGYYFYVDTSISHNPAAYGCVKKAMQEWVCATGVNFTIIGDTFGLNRNNGSIDNVSLITFKTVPSGFGAATTIRGDINCASPYTDTHYVNETDVLINPYLFDGVNSYGWWYDSTGTKPLPSDSLDFYHTVLHEIGHGVGLQHEVDSFAIMYAVKSYYGVTSAFNRTVNIRSDLSCIVGGRDEVFRSAHIPLHCFNNMIPLATCAGYTSIEDVSVYQSDILVSPNPFSNVIFIRFQNQNMGLASATITSMDGREITKWNLEGQSSLVETPLNLPTGIYIMLITTAQKTYIKKLVHVQE